MSALAPQRLIGPLGLAACPASNWIRTGYSVRTQSILHCIVVYSEFALTCYAVPSSTYLPNNGFKFNLEVQMFLPYQDRMDHMICTYYTSKVLWKKYKFNKFYNVCYEQMLLRICLHLISINIDINVKIFFRLI